MKKYNNPIQKNWTEIIKRPTASTADLFNSVKEVFDAVKSSGDQAIKTYTEKFDQVTLDTFLVSKNEIVAAINQVDENLKEAIKTAAANITRFHEAQCVDSEKIETMEGVTCWQESRGIDSVGIYIPGGTAPLFSTVLMLGIPAKLAGCKEVVLCTPPNEKGEVNPAILFAAELVGVKTILKVGGIQAIAGLTYGTTTIPKVFKIFGPGNQFVTAAKQYALQMGVAIDMPAGPSELLVMADNTADLEFVAADLLSQAEHGEDSQVITVLSDESLVLPLRFQIEKQLSKLPRVEIASVALDNSRLVVLNDLEQRISFVNAYAPEHLIIAEEEPEKILTQVSNAGSIFLGNYTPESAGDYASGTNHTLPTNGFAAMYSGVNLDAFVKKITVQQITETGIKNIGRTVELMAEAELLQAHKNAVTLRLNKLKS